MTKGDDATGESMVISHSITNFKSAIQPFAGRVNGHLQQSVESFIQSIDDLLESKGITDGREAFIEAKSHFNLSQGDLGDCTRSIFFRDCRTWEDLKGFLRDTYGMGESRDIVRDLRGLLKLHNRNGRSYVAQNAKINDATCDFVSKLEKSQWMDLRAQNGISLKNLGRLLQLSVGLHSLPDSLVETFDGEFSAQSTEKDVLEQINRNIGRLQIVDSSILHGSTKEAKQVGMVGQNKSN